MPKYIDTHSHFYDPAFAQDVAFAVRRAVECGVTRIILPDTNEDEREKMFELAARFPEHLYP